VSRESLQGLLQLLRKSTSSQDPPALSWLAEGVIEEASGEGDAALKSFDRAIAADGSNSAAYLRRAELRAQQNALQLAITDAESARRLSPESVNPSLVLANLHLRANRPDDALKVLDALPEKLRSAPPVASLRNTILATTAETPEARAALEELVQKDPKNAAILARLGALYRVDNPARSLEYYRRAVEVDPRNVDFATGYGSALVQARRFVDAGALLKQVIANAPDNYTAHANLATALYEAKNYPEAIEEYNWLLKAKPDLYVAYFFIATAYDYTGQYPAALAAYESFLQKADPTRNQLEIEKVNLRLPSLRHQIKRGDHPKQKSSD
jgi:tetratricopeptide (TPR) repeat protein